MTLAKEKVNDVIAEPFLRVKYVRGMFSFHLREEQHHLECMKRNKDAVETNGCLPALLDI